MPLWVSALGFSAGLFPTLTVLEYLKPRRRRRLAVVVLASAAVLGPAVVIWFAFGSSYATLFGWSWPATLASALVTLLVHGLRRYLVPDTRAFIRRRTR